MRQAREPIPYDVQAEVYFRDGWLCHLCRRPTIFHLAFKFLDEFVSADLTGVPLAYWHPNWRRDMSPLLDELGACIDHVEAFATGGRHDASNFATACSRCNTRKSARTKESYLEVANPWKVKGKHGEPTNWDGMTSLYVALARRSPSPLTRTEKEWLKVFESRLISR